MRYQMHPYDMYMLENKIYVYSGYTCGYLSHIAYFRVQLAEQRIVAEIVTRQSLPKTSVVRVSKRGLSDIESNTTVASHLRQNL